MSSEPGLTGQTVVVIGGSSGIGLETARLAREEGAHVIITARDPDRLHTVGLELGADVAAFDVTDSDRLDRFFEELERHAARMKRRAIRLHAAVLGRRTDSDLA